MLNYKQVPNSAVTHCGTQMEQKLTSKKLIGALPFLGAPGQVLPGLPPKGTRGAFGVPASSSEELPCT